MIKNNMTSFPKNAGLLCTLVFALLSVLLGFNTDGSTDGFQLVSK